MTKIFLTNTLSRKKEEFKPINSEEITMYVCGPTVYDRPHLGNARSAVVYDVLYRLLLKVYPKVKYVRNITDVDDKIINAAIENNESIQSLTTRITSYYHDDINALNCILPTYEPKASQYIAQMIKMIERLITMGHAYVAQKHVLFSVASFADYGKLANRSRDEMIAGARVEIAPFKKDPADFVLWKPSPESEFEFGFESPWGRGRPGWHIECSAMSNNLLGDVFDIHGGGADLMFPHHENEVAQSVCASSNHKFVRYWVHNGFLMVDGEKMSKSLGNFKTVRQVLDDGIEGVVIRYLYLTTHYRKPLDFTMKALLDATKSITRFREAIIGINKVCDIKEFVEIIADDLNTPQLLAKLHEYAHLALKGDGEAAIKVRTGCEFLGLDLSEAALPQDLVELAEKRLIAKGNKNWVLADTLRDEILSLGYEIKDGKDNYKLTKKSFIS